ncbi:single-stranded DNA-binding protein [Agrococcus sp. DT81.2]|uniref:single-stranded DNA-binding protein n=1 Tax=Agrococcus sp. DT81.2 TaxID=3393414 RepID=UPI003CE4B507
MTATITVSGGITNTPEIKQVGNGTLASFTVASTERYKKDDVWVDGKKLWLRCSAWRDVAAGIQGSLSSLEKGTQVTVTGKLYTREWEQDGQKRSSTELEVTDFAVSVKRATVQVTKTSGNSAGPSQQYAAPAQQQSFQPPQQDVWGAPGQAYPDSELPF